jgi:hypothetical protein
MKFNYQKSFQYPVLREGNNDYVDSLFEQNINAFGEEGMLTITVDYQLQNDDLQDKIKSGDAEFVTVINCRNTFYRKVIRTQESNTKLSIDSEKLNSYVKFSSYIIAKNEIHQFDSRKFNPEFDVTAFDIESGSVMAQTPEQQIQLHLPFHKNLSTCFILIETNKLDKGDWEIVIHGHEVHIRVSPETKSSIESAKTDDPSQSKSILLNSLWFAAMMHLIEAYRLGQIGDEGLAKLIEETCNAVDLEISDSDPTLGKSTSAIANTILQKPFALLMDGVDIFEILEEVN